MIRKEGRENTIARNILIRTSWLGANAQHRTFNVIADLNIDALRKR